MDRRLITGQLDVRQSERAKHDQEIEGPIGCSAQLSSVTVAVMCEVYRLLRSYRLDVV